MPYKNPARSKAYDKAYYVKHSVKMKSAASAHYKKNRAVIRDRANSLTGRLYLKAWRRTPKGRLNNLKHGAKVRQLVWELAEELALDLVTDSCYYCGAAPDPVNGIDRVDNSLGYTEDNVVACCKWCNIAKHTRTKEEYEAWLIRAAKHLINAKGATDGKEV